MRPLLLSSWTLIILLGACSNDSSAPPTGTAGVRTVTGSAVSDTIDALLPQALIVEVRDAAGQLTRGAAVRFESLPPADSARRSEVQIQVCGVTQLCSASGLSTFATDTTNGSGRATVLVRLGRVAGTARVRIAVPEFGYTDSARFDVKPGTATRVRAVAASVSVDIGGSSSVAARVVDRYENTRPEIPVLTLGTGVAVALNPANGIVTGRELGSQYVYARLGTLVDSTSVNATPPGRLLVWSSPERVIRLVNLNGTDTRTLANTIASDYGAFPRFDASRQLVSFHTGTSAFGGTPTVAVVMDTTGANRRDIAQAFLIIVSTRVLANGSLLVVASRAGSSGYSVWSVGTDNAVTLVRALSAGGDPYGAFDISPDGSRVAYPNTSGLLSVISLASGAVSVVDPIGKSPRWSPSGDRLAFLTTTSFLDGTLVVANPDGSNRRGISADVFSPGIAWSPDGTYLIGRSGPSSGLRVVRVSDGQSILLNFKSPSGSVADYYQPDWR